MSVTHLVFSMSASLVYVNTTIGAATGGAAGVALTFDKLAWGSGIRTAQGCDFCGRQARIGALNLLTLSDRNQPTKGFSMARLTASNVSLQEQLVSDMKSSIADAEDMLKDTADQVGDKFARLRSRIQDRLKDAKARLADAEEALVYNTRAAARATDDYVHESPWTAIGIAAGVGVLIGMTLGRR